MPLKPKNPDAPAKGMLWKFKNPEDNHFLQALHYDALKKKVRDYRRLNNYPIGSNFDSDFDANLCSHADSNDCYDDTIPPLTKRAVKFAKAMVNWAGSGFKTRSKEEVERVMNICEGCEHYTGESSPFKIACRRCGCSAKKLYIATEKCPIGRW